MQKNASEHIFLRRKKPKKQGLNVALLLDRRPVTGDVGLEIECEGYNLPKHDGWYIERDVNKKVIPNGPIKVRFPKQWRYTADHSLRGEDNAEYVLKDPIKFDEVSAALDDLWGMFRSSHTRLDESNRTSVHVHVNVQNFHMNRLTSFMAMYYVVEDILTKWCGEHRVGNLFCLSAKDAPGIIEQVKDFIVTDGKIHPQDNLHYAGLSFYAVKKFGSLEFRTLRGVTSPGVINDWVKIIRRMYDTSAKYPDPRELVHMFSGVGPLQWFETILGHEVLSILRRDIPDLSDEYIREKMYENIRIAQDLCFCRDWDEFETLEIKADPFGRSPSKILRMMTQENSNPMSEGSQGLQPSALSFASVSSSPPSAWMSQPSFTETYYSNQAPPMEQPLTEAISNDDFDELFDDED